ncbi:MAG: hypothetical protein WCG27_06515, partial [Pseudomonadota bacterium]
ARTSVQNALWKKLSQLKRLYDANSQEQLLKEAEKLASADCWALLTAPLKELLKSQSSDTAELAYMTLKWKNAVSDQERDLYLFNYLLRAPANGPSLNEAWGNLIELGKNHNRREVLLEIVKKIDPLPDQLFSIEDDKKKKVMAQHLFEQFPEYVSYYAQTCRNYLKGKGEFPSGNPTVNCRDFYRLSKGERWINEGLRLEFAGLQPKF